MSRARKRSKYRSQCESRVRRRAAGGVRVRAGGRRHARAIPFTRPRPKRLPDPVVTARERSWAVGCSSSASERSKSGWPVLTKHHGALAAAAAGAPACLLRLARRRPEAGLRLGQRGQQPARGQGRGAAPQRELQLHRREWWRCWPPAPPALRSAAAATAACCVLPDPSLHRASTPSATSNSSRTRARGRGTSASTPRTTPGACRSSRPAKPLGRVPRLFGARPYPGTEMKASDEPVLLAFRERRGHGAGARLGWLQHRRRVGVCTARRHDERARWPTRSTLRRRRAHTAERRHSRRSSASRMCRVSAITLHVASLLPAPSRFASDTALLSADKRTSRHACLQEPPWDYSPTQRCGSCCTTPPSTASP